MRKLASIRRIDSIDQIEGADAIEVATVGGWKVVVKRGEHQVCDLVVFCEIDSWIPTELAPFLSKGKEPREFNGVKGERLRTIRLRGQLSQGMLLPLSVLPDHAQSQFEGDDVTEVLGIQKWEPPIPVQLAGQMKGNFPSLIPKTDQERCQSLVNKIANAQGLQFEVTEKLEGSSFTAYVIDGEFGVCSRNIDLKQDENNSFWKVAIENDLEYKLKTLACDIAIQGELVGPGIQGNIYNLTKLDLFVFDIYSVTKGKYLNSEDRRHLCELLELKHVPVLYESFVLSHSVDQLLEMSEGKSALNPKQEREGLVFKQIDGEMTFKAISNQYLLKQK